MTNCTCENRAGSDANCPCWHSMTPADFVTRDRIEIMRNNIQSAAKMSRESLKRAYDALIVPIKRR